MSLRPHVQLGKVYISQKPKNLPKAYLKSQKVTYTDEGYARFIQLTTYVVKSKSVTGKRRPMIGVALQMGDTNKIHICAQEFEGLVLAFEEIGIHLREQLEKVQSSMDREVSNYHQP